MSDLVRTAPSMKLALADNYAALREAKFALQRARDRHAKAAPVALVNEWEQVIIHGSRVAELEMVRDQLLGSLAAHQLVWAHMYEDCPICTGAVNE